MDLQCKMCGGSVEWLPGRNVGRCLFCGSDMTLPTARGEDNVAAFNLANELRRRCDFDGAIAAYRNILSRDDTIAEAYWCVALSRYGVEYVEDPATKRRHPTLHRLSRKPILNDPDYLLALKYAPDEDARRLYREEAERISRICADALETVNSEPPCDVFICYREKGENGALTDDYGLAQSVYNKLDREGYRVFFAHISLLGKLGEAYEPCIYAALQSAKVMLLICTRPEHVNATWVRNEWSRYLALTEEHADRRLIVCYRDMAPEALPGELRYLQALNLADLSAMDSIMASVGRWAGRGTAAKPTASDDGDLRRLRALLSLGKYGNAAMASKRMAMQYSDNSVYWFYCAAAQTRNFSRDALSGEGMEHLATAKKLAELDPGDGDNALVLDACGRAEQKVEAIRRIDLDQERDAELRRQVAAREAELRHSRKALDGMAKTLSLREAGQAETNKRLRESRGKLWRRRCGQVVRFAALLASVFAFVYFDYNLTGRGARLQEGIRQSADWLRGPLMGLHGAMRGPYLDAVEIFEDYGVIIGIAAVVTGALLLRWVLRIGDIRKLKQSRARLAAEAKAAAEELRQLRQAVDREREAVRAGEETIAACRSEMNALEGELKTLGPAAEWQYEF